MNFMSFGETMPTKLNPYLNFRNNAREAIEFYHSVFGGKLTIGTFKEFHAAQDLSEENLVMHAELHTPNGLTLMASDLPNRMEYHPGNNFSVSLSGEDEAELIGYFQKLSTGGLITMPLAKSGWGDTFGMCTDRFGVSWLVNIAAPKV
jgi:PhnB protein